MSLGLSNRFPDINQLKPKTFRDILKKKQSPITVGDKKKVRKTGQNIGILDLSAVENTGVVLETQNQGRNKVVDVSSRKSGKTEGKVMFMRTTGAQRKSPDRVIEVVRMIAAGTLILFVIQIVNIYQRGMTIKSDVIASAFSGYDNLILAGDASRQANFLQAESSFEAATQKFNDALGTIRFLETNQDAFFTRAKTVESAKNLLEAGKNISEAGADFVKGIGHLRNLPTLFLEKARTDTLTADVKPEPLDESTITPKVEITTVLKQDLVFLQNASTKIDAASQNLANVSVDVLPESIKPKLQKARDAITKLQGLLKEAKAKIPVIMKMLGDRYLHRYLILLQNDAEARPTGGFIGSYMIVDVNDGAIQKTEFHDVYETDGQLSEDIPAPEDIARVSKNWRLRDSNYSPDYAISAEKAAWFLQKEKGPSVDSVIAINQSLVAKLFDVTGPVHLEGLTAPLTKENYQTLISYLVESKLSGAEDPKKILRSFIPAFQKQLISTKDFGKLIKVIVEALKNRDIIMYSRDSDIQNLYDELGISGRSIRTKPNEDYLQVIVTSIGGNKSDRYIEQSLKHNTIIAKDGTVTDELTITRKHTWTEAELSHWKSLLKDFGFTDLPKGVQFILGSGENKSIVKVYVPQGSVLGNTAGIDKNAVVTRDENDIQKSYFMFEMDIAAGEEQSITISYQLPVKMNLGIVDTYRFFAQRQPGIVLSKLEKNLIPGQGLKIFETSPANLSTNEKTLATQKLPLENDDYMAAVVGVDN